ncbi:pre-60S factor rei1 [Vanrija albida]|uniref:Pre-60S factor rei1 n=1 Tax=Vanrija albida TaxID=181172 RepID=A0ABR3Q1H9_9TREE
MVVQFAVPMCSLSQMRRLARVASPSKPKFSPKDQRLSLIEEYTLCLLLPLLKIPLAYTVQGHRYDIVQSIGCGVPQALNWPSIVIHKVINLLVASLCLIYACVAARFFLKRRLHFRSVLVGSGLTPSRYLRLIGLAISISFVVVAATLLNLLVRTVAYGHQVVPVGTWDNIHHDYNLISQFPEEIVETATSMLLLVVPFYFGPIYSIVFFAFFGFGEEAVSEYLAIWEHGKRWLRWCRILKQK